MAIKVPGLPFTQDIRLIGYCNCEMIFLAVFDLSGQKKYRKAIHKNDIQNFCVFHKRTVFLRPIAGHGLVAAGNRISFDKYFLIIVVVTEVDLNCAIHKVDVVPQIDQLSLRDSLFCIEVLNKIMMVEVERLVHNIRIRLFINLFYNDRTSLIHVTGSCWKFCCLDSV